MLTAGLCFTLGASAGTPAACRPLLLTVADVKGSYTIPHIQTSRNLAVPIEFAIPAQTAVRVQLQLDGATLAETRVNRADPVAQFADLAPAEYALHVEALGANGATLATTVLERIGIGTVIGALGDSITEGYHSRWFWQDDLNLTADRFPADAVSRDGRNFPQYTPTTAWHRPEVNCFQSWLTTLNNLLTDAWKQPVFIANEGLGGHSAAAYLKVMRTDAGWQRRMQQLQPTVWLIHLGVNDERAKITAAAFAADMDAIVALLLDEYKAEPGRVFVAKPCYDYAAGAAPILAGYCTEIDKLVAKRGLRHGADFYKAYATDKDRWYGADPVHPNIAGMEYMAQLWFNAIVAAGIQDRRIGGSAPKPPLEDR
jgi:lysophospholipase L1-like esterase